MLGSALVNLRQFAADMRRVRDQMPEAKAAALRSAAESVRDEAKALIGTELADWPALAGSTIAEKRRLGFAGKVSDTDPLLRTGELRATIQVGEITPQHAVVGTDDPIAAYQEFGTERIPPRPFIGAAVFRTEAVARHKMAMVLVETLKGRPVAQAADDMQLGEAAE